MPSLRASALTCGIIFALVVATGIAGNLAPPGTVTSRPWLELAARVVFFTLTAALVFSFVPLMVNVVFGGLRAAADDTRLAPLLGLRVAILWTIWGLMAAGTIVAVAAAIRFGAFR